MTKEIKKIAAIAASMMLVFSMAAAVYADDDPATFTNGVVETDNVKINIKKTLTVKNPVTCTVKGPGITYTYAVASVTPSAENGGTSVRDNQDREAHVEAMPADAVSLVDDHDTAAFLVSDDLNASEDGEPNVRNITAEVDISKFTHAGIFRCSITETPTIADNSVAEGSREAAVGVTELASPIDRVRYLDVYVINDGDGLKVSGYVVHTKNGNQKIEFSQQVKNDGALADPPVFETKNITLTKQVGGNMGDKQHPFAFTATVQDTENRQYYASMTAPADGAIGDLCTAGTATSPSLKHGETYYINGVSTVATVAYVETNNTSDKYKVTITGRTPAASSDAVSPVAAGATKEMSATNVTQAAAVTFTNELDSVSPTGVIRRFGPYIGMVLIALALIAFMKKRMSSNK